VVFVVIVVIFGFLSSGELFRCGATSPPIGSRITEYAYDDTGRERERDEHHAA
jgi:hypothetical protein